MCVSPRFQLVLWLLVLLASAAVAQTADEFTIVALPDTQHYSSSYPHIFAQQTKWIADNAAPLNLKFVLGLGDIVDDGAKDSQWQNADAAVRTLDNARIPYVLALGNHDYMYTKVSSRDATLFNRYFGPPRYAGRPWYKSNYPSGSNENFYAVFNLNGRNYLVLALETFPRDAALNWASGVLAANRDKDAIIVTHSYIYKDSTRIGRCDSNSASSFGVANDNDGDEMWAKFISKHPNVIMALNGHTHGVGRRTDVAADGHIVNQMLADYQDEPNGGNGWLRILKVRPSLNQVEVLTYSPFLNQWRSDAGNHFTLKLKGTAVGTVGRVSGKVRTTSCAAVAGATISAGTSTAQTDANGTFNLPLTAPAAYSVAAARSGYNTSTQTASVFGGYASWTDFFLSQGSSSGAPCTLSSASPSVTICTPTSGATVTSPVRVLAGTTSSSAVTAMKIYLDGVAGYTTNGSTLDAGIPMAAGTRRLTVQAWNSAGQAFNQTIYVTVGSTSGGGSSCVFSTADHAITICSPADAGTVASPLRVLAGTTTPVTLSQVYLDGSKVYEVAAGKVDVQVSAAGGSHRLTVQARDTAGLWFKKTIYFTAQ